MANGIIAGTSSIAGNVLTLTFVVAPGNSVTNYDLTVTFDHTKATLNPDTDVTTGLAGFVSANLDTPDSLLISSTSSGAAVAAGGTVLTVKFTLNGVTTLPLTYTGSFNVDSTPLATTGLIASNGSVESNAPTQGVPTITGTVTEDQTLTAVTTAITDGDGPNPITAFTYQWLRNDEVIAGATSKTYTLGNLDAGEQISVRVSYTDGAGHQESVTSAKTASVVNVPDAPQGTVTVTGNNAVGATLTATNNLTDGDVIVPPITYKWYADDVLIANANASTYQLTANEVGKVVKAEANYVDGFGHAEAVKSAGTTPVVEDHLPTGTFGFSPGTIFEDQRLDLTDSVTDADGVVSRVYKWFRADDQSGTNKVQISGASSASYTMTQADAGKFVSASVTITDALGNVKTVDSNQLTEAVRNVNDQPTGSVTISNQSNVGQPPKQGDVLAAANTLADEDGIPATGAGAITYSWFAGATQFATGATATLGQTQVGQAITVKATYTDNFSNTHTVTGGATAAVANVNDAPTGSVTIANTTNAGQDPKQGDTLTASNTLADLDGIPASGAGAITYAWFAGSSQTAFAIGSSVTLAQAQVGSAITVKATYTDNFANTHTVASGATAAVADVNDPPVSTLAITGSLAVGATLGFTGTLTDVDGIPNNGITYSWLANDVEVGTGTTYKLKSADLGATIKLVASYTDNGAHHEVVTVTGASAVRANAAATGTITVAGVTGAKQGNTLTVTNAVITDQDNADAHVAIPTLSYQWYMDNGQGGETAIANATGTSFTLTEAQVGRQVWVRASFTDVLGVTEGVDSAKSAAIINVDDQPSGVVTITGTVAQNQTLTASNTIADADGIPASGANAITYHWFAGNSQTAFSTGPTVVLAQDQVGKTITVQAVYTDNHGTATTVTSGMTAAVANINDMPTGTVTVTGTYTQGQTLNVTNTVVDIDGIPGTGANALTYHWFAGASEITAAAGQSSYTLTQAEVGKVITVKAVYTDLLNTTSESVTSATPGQSVGNINDAPVNTLAMTGSLAVGATLGIGGTVTDLDGIGNNGPITYHWLADDVEVATGTTYKLTADELGKTIKLTASYQDNFGQNESVTVTGAAAVRANAAATGTVTVSGVSGAKQGDVLTVTGAVLTDQDNTDAHVAVPTPTYKWYMDDGQGGETAIANATGSSFTLTQAQVGHQVWVRAGFTDVLGVDETVDSARSAAIINVNDAPTGSVTIDKTSPKQGDTLTASNTLSDPDGIPATGAGAITYSWFAGSSQTAFATGATVVLGQDQVGKTITVKASYVDNGFGGGAAQPVSSAATTAVANVNDVATGRPTFTSSAAGGAIEQNATLTAAVNAVGDLDGISHATFAYQWFASANSDGSNATAISGATGSTFKLTQAQVDKYVYVRAQFTDDLGGAESVVSLPSTKVANVNDAPTGLPTIDGAKVIGMPLTVSLAKVVDLDGIPTTGDLGAAGVVPAYKWYANDVEINATNFAGGDADFVLSNGGATITLKNGSSTTGFGGKTITASVTYTDKYGQVEGFTKSQIASVVMAKEDDAPGLSTGGLGAGDGNGDGVLDSAQDSVASAPFAKVGATGGTPTFVTLVANSTADGGATQNSTAVIQTINQEAAAPSTKPTKMDTPLGIIDFTATTTVSKTETFTLFADQSLKVNGYWKQDLNGKWVNLASEPYGGSTTIVGNKIKLTFKITDGDLAFDGDHTANGIIVDPGCIASLPLSLVGYTPDVVLTAQTHFFF